MITLRKSNERGGADHGWLKTRHTFSFSTYYDPAHMGFRALRVMNEDWVAPSQGFGKHPHDNMEILTYVLEGALKHQDSMGNGEVVHAGELQRMSAGTGIHHSEFNASQEDPVRLYQIWLLPGQRGLEPGYEQKAFSPEDKKGRLRLVASPAGEDGALTIHQDVRIYLAGLTAGESLAHTLQPGRHAWVQVISGAASVNGQALKAGDGAAISDETTLTLAGRTDAEIMLFDLA
ncbi:MAG: pirin family protein [Candidatus Hydrogenedentes bacterium]|nr:pirin family protein [Candidatus Hydrogenedentota bacterium]